MDPFGGPKTQVPEGTLQQNNQQEDAYVFVEHISE